MLFSGSFCQDRHGTDGLPGEAAGQTFSEAFEVPQAGSVEDSTGQMSQNLTCREVQCQHITV